MKFSVKPIHIHMAETKSDEIRIDLGCGRRKKPGFIGIDKYSIVEPDIVCDVEIERLPFDDSSVDEIFSSHVFEHIRDIQAVMNECHRVLAPAGRLTIQVPYWTSEGAFRDPTHVRFFTEKSFDYWQPDCVCAYYASSAPFEIIKIDLELHPSPLVRLVKRIFGIRLLKAFNNMIIGISYQLKPIK
ncbi:MAG: methyltransferase domain-containing protein [Proteobacteria bacterium]|nr:methyltransferase domain-containing protein [Pseudomonadota bacterium]